MDITLKSRFETFAGLTGSGDTLRADATEPTEAQRLRLCDIFGVPYSVGDRRPQHDELVILSAASDDDPLNVCFPPWDGGDLRATHAPGPTCRMRIRRMDGDGMVRSGDRVAFCSPERVTQNGSSVGVNRRRKWLKAGDDPVHTLKIESWADSPGDGEIFVLDEAVVLPGALEGAVRWFQTPTWAAAMLVRLTAYPAHAARLRGLGYRLVHLQAISSPVPAFNDLWTRDASGTEWQHAIGLSESSMRNRSTQLTAQGFVPMCTARYRQGPLLRFAGVWHKAGAGAGDIATTHLGTRVSDYQALFAAEVGAGRSPRSLHADVEIGGARLASVFARLPMGRFLAHHDIDGSTHQLHFGDDAHHGMRPVAMTGWRRSGEDRWASIWRPTTSEWTARHGIDSNEAMRETVRRGGRGLEPAFLSGHATTGGARWAGGWVRPRRQFTVLGEVGSADFCNQLDAKMRDYMQKHDIPGAQLAVTRGGSFLHCRAYTWADSRQPPITPRTRFRLASISKPITAAAIEWLIQEGRLQRDAKVFELLGLATPSGNDRARRFARITVDHLLTHTGGWKRADSDTSPLQQDPMMIDELVALGRPPFTTPVNTRDIAEYVLRHRPPQFEPGSAYSYSNFGYCLLGRVIEKVNDRPYEAFVRDILLAPLGIHRMQLGRSAMEHALSEEAPYFTRGVANARNVLVPASNPTAPLAYGGLNLENMDSHGGWVSSAADLLRFAWSLDIANLDANKPLRPSTLDAMRRVPLVGGGKRVPRDDSNLSTDDNDRSKYARGISVHIADGTPLDEKLSPAIWHNGSLPGTRTEFKQGMVVKWKPGRGNGGSSQLGVALLFNKREPKEDPPSDPEGLADWSTEPTVGTDWDFDSFIRDELLPDSTLVRPTIIVHTSGA